MSAAHTIDQLAQIFHERYGNRARFVRGRWFVDQTLSVEPTDLASQICHELGRTDLLNYRSLSAIVRKAAAIQKARPWTLAEALAATPPTKCFARFPKDVSCRQHTLLEHIGRSIEAKKRSRSETV